MTVRTDGVAVEVDPAEVGMDADRLARIDRHFARYVDDGRLAGWHAVVARRGRVVHSTTYGLRDEAAGLPVTPDTRWRLMSMTKPVTSVAAMILWERGELELTDPVSRWIPAFADTRVFAAGSAADPVLVPQVEPLRVWHLLTHTAGLTYGFHHAHPVDELYRHAGFEYTGPPGLDLAGCVDRWASLPLLHQPGAEWNYGHATDVLGRVVEIVSGRPLDRFLAEEILGPLGMRATGFVTDDPELLARVYAIDPTSGRRMQHDAMGRAGLTPPTALSGGGGLVGTAGDYHRFVQMLACGGQLDGVRILGPRTVSYMVRNHLPGDVDMAAFGRPSFGEMPYPGIGFGLGFSVVLDPVAFRTAASVGAYAWGGVASTGFWVDPVEQVTALFLTQLVPSSAYPIRTQFRQLVHQALVD
jgi:CubicO group peptidase (beta-lactamase class C family)